MLLFLFAQYPDWIAANRGKHTPEAFAMFDKQFDCFSRLSVELDKPGEDTTIVMALMQEVRFVCLCGSVFMSAAV
jgi:hypothetical protein